MLLPSMAESKTPYSRYAHVKLMQVAQPTHKILSSTGYLPTNTLLSKPS